MRPRWPALVLLLVATLAHPAPAQSSSPPPATPSSSPDNQPITTLKLVTKVVGIAAVVRDKSGRPIGGLAREDFELKQDGKPQDLRYFSQGSDLPLTLALMIDTSGSQKNFIPDETAASMVFFRAMITAPADRAALVQFDSAVLQRQTLTHSVDNLQRSLGYMSDPRPTGLRPLGSGGTLLYDGLCAVAARTISSEPGRKAIVLLTDGGDVGSHFSLADAIAAVQRVDAVVYSVYYSEGNRFNIPLSGRAASERAVLEKLSAATGGKVFDVNARQTLRAIYAEIAQDMRLQYQLGYNPPPSDVGAFHRIELKMKDRKLSVQARTGYFSK